MSLLREAQRCIRKQAEFKHLNAFITLRPESQILALARQADDELLHAASAERPATDGTTTTIATTTTHSSLRGRLIAVKDNICTAGSSALPTTTAASRSLRNFKSPYDATVVQSLEAAGAILAGKTNLDEFGMGSHSDTSYFSPVRQQLPGHHDNSSNNKRGDGEETLVSAGGSSGGSAVAVATAQCWAALGTDTGGSVRLPASYNGIVGFKPSYGLLSRWGVLAYANSLDTVGILAPDTSVARGVFRALNRHDARDPTSLSESLRTRCSQRGDHRRRECLRIGVPAEYNIRELSPSIRAAWSTTLRRLQKQGHAIKHVSLPTTPLALSAYYVLAPAEASSNLAKYDGVRFGTRSSSSSPTPSAAADPAEDPQLQRSGSTQDVLYARTRGENFGEEVKRRILLGAYSLSAEAMDNYFIQAQRVRRLVQRDFDRVFRIRNPLLYETDHDEGDGGDGVDVIVCPTAQSTAPSLKTLEKRGRLEKYTDDVFTVPASLAGLPAVSVPVRGRSSFNSSPSFDDVNRDNNGDAGAETGHVGIQVIGQFGCDEAVLEVAETIESLG